MEYTYGINDDYLDDDDDGVMYSTQNYSSDSEEEKASAFTLSKKSFKKLEKRTHGANEEDDFEKEMAAELNATVKSLTTNASTSSSNNEETKNPIDSEYYDKMYFDSDESSSDEEEEPSTPNPSSKKRKAKHRVLTNDELFYDPEMDDDDQEWVDSNRRSYQVKRKRSLNEKGKFKHQPLPQSDAVLNCPACFTTLCLDCQRHEIYENQYRAMFVFNCTVDKSEVLHFAVKEEKKSKFKKRKNKKQSESSTASTSNGQSESVADATECPANIGGADDTFHSVKCDICSTKVAVQDQDELYHFFNVLTSY